MKWIQRGVSLLVLLVLFFSLPLVFAASCDSNSQDIGCNSANWRLGNSFTFGPATYGDGFLAIWSDSSSNFPDFRVTVSKNGIQVADKTITRNGHIYDIPITTNDQVTLNYFDCTDSGVCDQPWFGMMPAADMATENRNTCGSNAIDIASLVHSAQGTQVGQAQCWSNSQRTQTTAAMSDYAIIYTFIPGRNDALAPVAAANTPTPTPTPTPKPKAASAKKSTTKKSSTAKHAFQDTAIDTRGLLITGGALYGCGILFIVTSQFMRRKSVKRLRIVRPL